MHVYANYPDSVLSADFYWNVSKTGKYFADKVVADDHELHLQCIVSAAYELSYPKPGVFRGIL